MSVKKHRLRFGWNAVRRNKSTQAKRRHVSLDRITRGHIAFSASFRAKRTYCFTRKSQSKFIKQTALAAAFSRENLQLLRCTFSNTIRWWMIDVNFPNISCILLTQELGDAGTGFFKIQTYQKENYSFSCPWITALLYPRASCILTTCRIYYLLVSDSRSLLPEPGDPEKLSIQSTLLDEMYRLHKITAKSLSFRNH